MLAASTARPTYVVNGIDSATPLLSRVAVGLSTRNENQRTSESSASARVVLPKARP